MIYKIILTSLLISAGIAFVAYTLGWVEFNTVIVMAISGTVGGLIAYQSAKNHNNLRK